MLVQKMSPRTVARLFDQALSSPSVESLSEIIKRAPQRQVLRIFSTKKYIHRVLGKRSLLRIAHGAPLHSLIGVAKATFADIACGIGEALEALRTVDTDYINDVDEKCIKTVASLGVDPAGFLSNIVAYTVASNIVMKANSTQLTQTGRVVFISGEIGSGKTTLAFWSTALPLFALGFDWDSGLRVVNSLWVQSLSEFLAVAQVAGELARSGGMLPFIVLEDAAVVFSKYQLAPFFSESAKASRAAARISEAFQVIREGVGTLIVNATPSALVKPLREMSGIRLDGSVIPSTKYRRTLWIAQHGKSIVDVFGTVHPVLKTPDELLSIWLSKKLMLREAALRKAGEKLGEEAAGKEDS